MSLEEIKKSQETFLFPPRDIGEEDLMSFLFDFVLFFPCMFGYIFFGRHSVELAK